MYKLVIVRHGESEWNKLNLFTGWSDVELSEKGMEEAAQAGKTLKQEGYFFDVCYTSYLKRAIHTAQIALDNMDLNWVPLYKTWKLNERHYGALQGLNKAETAAKYGDEKVLVWRRSFDVQPPALSDDSPMLPAKQIQYQHEDPASLPKCESLKDTIARVMPWFEATIVPELKAGKKIAIFAHGNSLRALVKNFEQLSDEAIAGVNIPTGIPLVYDLDENMHCISKAYVGDPAEIEARINAVKNQGKAKK